MKTKIISLTSIFVFVTFAAYGQTERTINSVQLKAGMTSNVTGNLTKGSKLSDLLFAWNVAGPNGATSGDYTLKIALKQ